MSELDSTIFKRTLFRAIILQPFLLAALAGLLLWQIDRVLFALGWVEPSSPVIEQAHNVRELLVNMEFGLEGYLTTGDPELVEHYVEAAPRLGKAMRVLEGRVAAGGFPSQERAVARLTSTLPEWRAAARALIAARQCPGEGELLSLRAASLMDSMKSAIFTLVDSEFTVQQERLDDRRETVRLAIGIALLATLLLGLGVAYSARRQLLNVSRSFGEAIEDQRSRADALRAARANAEAANRAKDDFLATVSHELRSPLNAVLTAAQVLKMPGLDETRTTRALEMIDRNVKRQARLIEDLLDVSRIVAGKLTLDAQRLDLVPILREAVQGVRPAAEAAKVELEADLPEEPAPVWGDHGRLLQIFNNVLSNATKFTPEGGRVSVSLDVSQGIAEVSVRDTGIGIPAEVLPRIFDRFEQADSSSTRKHGGLGLGLAIARHLVTLHHGTIDAVSDGPDRGSTFRVRLPIERLGLDRPGDGVYAHDREHAPDALDDLRVLVVDDEEDARNALAMLLSMRGARVSRAVSVAEALTTLVAFPADVVLTDVAMPEQDGYELLRAIRADDATRGVRRPIVAVTAMASAEDRGRLIRAGFDLHVTKPIDPEELIAAVVRVAPAKPPAVSRAIV